MPVTTEPSVCIPRTLNNVGWNEVKDAFEGFIGKGTVERVDIVVPREGDRSFCKIFVHFRFWPDTDVAQSYRNHLLAHSDNTLKLVHGINDASPTAHWKCSASRTAKPERNAPKVVPHIELSSDKNLVPPKLKRQNGHNSDDDMVASGAVDNEESSAA